MLSKHEKHQLWILKCENFETCATLRERGFTYFQIMPWMCRNRAPVHGKSTVIIWRWSDPWRQLFHWNSSWWGPVSGHNRQWGPNWSRRSALYVELSAFIANRKKNKDTRMTSYYRTARAFDSSQETHTPGNDYLHSACNSLRQTKKLVLFNKLTILKGVVTNLEHLYSVL